MSGCVAVLAPKAHPPAPSSSGLTRGSTLASVSRGMDSRLKAWNDGGWGRLSRIPRTPLPRVIRRGTQWVAVVIEGALVVGFDRGKGGVHCMPQESW